MEKQYGKKKGATVFYASVIKILNHQDKKVVEWRLEEWVLL
jgi:hypothetical protein